MSTAPLDPSLVAPAAERRKSGLTGAERRTREYLAERAPDEVADFLDALGGARLTLLERLAGALVREGLLQGTEREGDALAVPLGAGTLVARVAARRAFGRVELKSPIVWERPDGPPVELTHPLALSALLDDGDAGWRVLGVETADGCANLALARAYAARKRRDLGARARALGAHSAAELASALRRVEPGFSASTFFERLCVEGHRLHPGAKTRLGLSPEAVVAYGPEFDGEPALRLVAVLRSRVRWAGFADPSAPILAAHPAIAPAARRELSARGLDPDAYALVPVHPWQCREALPRHYAAELAERVIVPLAGVSLPCEATAAFRTLAPAGGGPYAFKVAVDAQMTSTVRSISPQTALNAPRFSAMIAEVFRREPALARAMTPVDEVAGVCFEPDATEPDGDARRERRRNLTAVYRVHVDTLVGPDELPIVGAALYAESPVSGRLVGAELIAAFGRERGIPTPREAALAFVRAYAEKLVPGALTLLARYGVALEAHLQNCVPVFAGGTVRRVLIRDWGGARVHRPRLAAQGLEADFEPGSLTVTDELAVARAKLFYTLFQNHLAEIVAIAAAEAHSDEAPCWAIVREVAGATYRDLAADPATREAARSDWAALSAPLVPHKALASMRLRAGGGDHHVLVPNPLAEGPAPW
jgi:siderophore synthetase component